MTLEPESSQAAAEALVEATAHGRGVRAVGGRSRMWGHYDPRPRTELCTRRMARVVEHNRGDYTAVLQPGLRLAEAQAAFAEAGQMLAWDPPLGDSHQATVGGTVATADSGPLRHRFGGVRDTVIGATVVLSDGTVARSGGKVIKNVAGYDLAKIFTGSFGRLGLISEVAVRLHPLIKDTVTLAAHDTEPSRLCALALELARRPLEADCLDLRWQDGRGLILLRLSGSTMLQRARSLRPQLSANRVDLVEDDKGLWARQREAQRSPDAAVLKVSALPTDLPRLIEVAQSGNATLVARAGLGLGWLRFAPGPDLPRRVQNARLALAPRHCLALDGAERAAATPRPNPSLDLLTERLERRLDPAGTFTSARLQRAA